MDRDFIIGLKKSFESGFVETVVEKYGHKWKLRTLTDREAYIRDKFVPLTTDSTLLSGRKTATLALAIKEIDNRLVSDVFGSGDGEKSPDLNEVENGIYQIAKKLKEFLDDLPSYVIDDLYAEFNLLEMRARQSSISVISDSGGENAELDKFRSGVEQG